MRLSIGAILMVTVPETIMRSEWRGEAKGTMPRRSTSKREANVTIISMAQQARPNVTGQTEDLRAQLKKASATVVTMKPPGKLKTPSSGVSRNAGCVSPSGRVWWSFSHSWRSLNSVQTAGGGGGVGAVFFIFMFVVGGRRSPHRPAAPGRGGE